MNNSGLDPKLIRELRKVVRRPAKDFDASGVRLGLGDGLTVYMPRHERGPELRHAHDGAYGIMKLTLDLPPNMLNGRPSRLPWAVKLRLKKAYYLKAQVDLQNQRREWWNVKVPVPAHFTATLFVHQLMDPDNMVARLKWSWDSLVHAGVLFDDTHEYLDPTVRQEVDRKNPRVELEL